MKSSEARGYHRLSRKKRRIADERSHRLHHHYPTVRPTLEVSVINSEPGVREDVVGARSQRPYGKQQ